MSLLELITEECPVCGALYRNANLHQQFHDGLRLLAKMVEAPEATDEEYATAIAQAWIARGRKEAP